MWFSVGVGFSLSTLIVTSMFCAWESAKALRLFGDNAGRGKNWSALLFGFSPSVSGLRISLADFAYVALSSVVSIAAHEVGMLLQLPERESEVMASIDEERAVNNELSEPSVRINTFDYSF